MSDKDKYSFIVVKYAEKAKADAALKEALSMAKEKVVKLRDAVVITKTEKGGIEVKPTVTLTKITSEMAADMVAAHGYVNAEVIIREDVDEEQLIDVLTGNRVYLRSATVVNKIDLLPHLDVDMDLFRRNLAAVNPHAHVLMVSSKTGEGVDAWLDWVAGA